MEKSIPIPRRMVEHDRVINLWLGQAITMKYILEKIKLVLGSANALFDTVIGDIAHIAELVAKV